MSKSTTQYDPIEKRMARMKKYRARLDEMALKLGFESVHYLNNAMLDFYDNQQLSEWLGIAAKLAKSKKI